MSASEDNPVYRWLHLSDLHVGCKGEALWWQTLEHFERSLGPWLAKVGPPDLLLLTGDLTWSGAAKEYDRLDQYLERLLGVLESQTGDRPLVVPVAGNHDVQRPTPQKMATYRVIDAYESAPHDEDVKYLQAQLWKKHKAGILAKLFTNYTRWLERTVVPQLIGKPGVVLHRSFFPGDLTVTLDLPGRFPLGVVALNSAWSHFKGGDFAGKLILPAEQFYSALPDPAKGASPLDYFAQVERALLLMHHPRKWFTSSSRDRFDGLVHLGHRFTACLFGHMHEPDAVNLAQAGGASRSFYQAPSLFGVEDYGTAKESRVFGYTFGQLARNGEIRLWPLRATRHGDGVWAFDRYTYFHWPSEDTAGVLLRPSDPNSPPGTSTSPRPTAAALDLNAFCTTVRDATRHIRLDGIAAAAKALNYPIERLYTRLRTHARGHVDDRHGLVDLADLLLKHHRLLIEGQPGSGKTTFLKLAASVLARDFLDEPCPEGTSWRAAYLGRGVARTLPIFLKLSSLATTAKDTRKGAARLLDLLVGETEPAAGDAPQRRRARREAWDAHLLGGEATLLLDGLDEVGDPDLRAQLLGALTDILRAWPKCQVILTSRPISIEPLKALEFVHASVAPFGPDEVRAYVERWVHAYFETDPDKARGTTEAAYAEKLIQAVRSRQELRRLASAPVMLTCLCVVYSHGGGLPEGRAELYRDTIRWLIASREPVRQERGYGGVRVQEALSVLALTMMGGAKGPKRRELGLKDAAAAVDAIVRGSRFDLGNPISRSEAIIAWLRFECEYSGVIEEFGAGQLQFKHLTFQEYLAAAQLAATPNRGWWNVIRARLQDLQWRETIDLFPGCLLDRERGATSDADFLMSSIHGLWRTRPVLLRAATITAITGRFLPAFRCAKYHVPDALSRRDADLRAKAEAIFDVEGAAKIPEKLRIAVAQAIGVAGDARIAAGRFEANLLPVPGTNLRIAKYTVTVEEFARFIDDGGYERKALWLDEDAWSLRTRKGWLSPHWWDGQFVTPNLPVTGVSWFEAMAYCRWLTSEHPQLHVRLPTREEWIAVASPDGRRYPWRGRAKPDDTRANFGKRQMLAPSPVGIYPAGDSEFGHCDLAGNVLEWNLDICEHGDVEEEEEIDEEEDHYEGPPRHILGGHWWSDARSLANQLRWGRMAPNSRISLVGFRVAAVPANP